MRVTSNMIADHTISYLAAHMRKLDEIQEIAATGKKINRPSDDPVGTGRIMDDRTAVSSMEQYNRNILDGKTRLDITENVLKAVNDQIASARGLAAVGTSADLKDDLMIADNIAAVREQLMQYVNTKYRGDYLFSGYRTDTQPFAADGTWMGDEGEIRLRVGENSDVKINVTGTELFSVSGGTAEIFTALEALETGFRNHDSAMVRAQIPTLDAAKERLEVVRSANGVSVYRLESAEQFWSLLIPKIENLIADRENADAARTVIELKQQETAYETSLALAARIMQKGLVDYL